MIPLRRSRKPGRATLKFPLRSKATLDSLMVKKGGGVWVNLVPVPIKGQKGRYAVDFPIRPGDTLFKFVYHLPYSEPTRLQVKLPYPIRNFAVMHPPSMSFKPSSAAAFTSPGMAQGLRVEQAVGKPVVRDVAAFEISGIGLAAPTQAARASSAMSSTAPLAPPSLTRQRQPPFRLFQAGRKIQCGYFLVGLPRSYSNRVRDLEKAQKNGLGLGMTGKAAFANDAGFGN